MRLGRIPWINCYPIYRAIDRGLVPTIVHNGDRHRRRAERSARRRRTRRERGVRGRVRPARRRLSICSPTLAISCDGPVHSVALFSRVPVERLDAATILVTASSRTSVLLLELLCRHRWDIRPRFATVRAEPQDLAALDRMPHEAVLVIGDAALQLQSSGRYPVVPRPGGGVEGLDWATVCVRGLGRQTGSATSRSA